MISPGILTEVAHVLNGTNGDISPPPTTGSGGGRRCCGLGMLSVTPRTAPIQAADAPGRTRRRNGNSAPNRYA